MSKIVGITGIGIMGSAMSANLIKAGFAVVGFDPSAEAMAAHKARGGTAAGSPREVAEAAPVIISSLPSAAALLDVATGIAAAKGQGQIVIECSTLPLETKREAHEILAKSGKILLDCPVSGTGAQAARKDLVVFASGDADAFERCGAVFDGMSRRRTYLGPFGHGSVMKYLANLLVTIHNVATAEAMVLGMKAGLDPALIYDTLVDSAGTSRILEVRGPLMRDNSYDEPTATIKTHMKDMATIEAFANDLGCPVPLFAVASQIHYAGAGQGRAYQDTAAVCAVLENMAGVTRPASPPHAKRKDA
jgi:putative dehydrogenase